MDVKVLRLTSVASYSICVFVNKPTNCSFFQSNEKSKQAQATQEKNENYVAIPARVA